MKGRRKKRNLSFLFGFYYSIRFALFFGISNVMFPVYQGYPSRKVTDKRHA